MTSGPKTLLSLMCRLTSVTDYFVIASSMNSRQLEAVIELARAHPSCDHLIASYVKGNQKMARFLEKKGFILDSEEERELVFRLETP